MPLAKDAKDYPRKMYGHGVSLRPYDPTKCAEQMWSGFTHHQCRNKPKEWLFCGVHSVSTCEKRKAKHDAKWAQWAKDREAANKLYEHNQRLLKFEPKLLAAMREIATGSLNDPAGYAAMKLEMLGVRPDD
jgi:hypothetical protein